MYLFTLLLIVISNPRHCPEPMFLVCMENSEGFTTLSHLGLGSESSSALFRTHDPRLVPLSLAVLSPVLYGHGFLFLLLFLSSFFMGDACVLGSLSTSSSYGQFLMAFLGIRGHCQSSVLELEGA